MSLPIRRYIALLILVLISILVVMPLMAAPPGFDQSKSGAPINIYSQKLMLYPKKSKAHFKGDVRVVQDLAEMKSQSMFVTYDEKAQSQIQLIEVDEDVQLTLPDRKVTANKGRYETATGKIVLDGDVEMTKGDVVIQGTQFIYDAIARKSSLKGTKKPEVDPAQAERERRYREAQKQKEDEWQDMAPKKPVVQPKEEPTSNPLKAFGKWIGSIFD